MRNNLYPPARYPVNIHSSRGHYEYGATCARPIPLGTRAVALLKNEELVEGTVDQAGLSKDGKAFVVLAGQQLLLSDIAVLEALPSLH